MSSHHFVTEDQEPVLVFDNGPYCSMELMGQLLEWSPKVITLEDAGYRLTEMGIKVDVMICKKPPPEDFVQVYHPIKVILTEEGCFEFCLKYLQKQNYLNAHFLWVNDVPAFEQLLFDPESHFHFVIWNDSYKAFAITGSFEKFYGQGTKLQLVGNDSASGEINIGQEKISIPAFRELQLDKNNTIKVHIHSGRVLLKEFPGN